MQADLVRHWQNEASKCNVMLSEWTKKLIDAETSCTQAQEAFDRLVEEIQARRKAN